MCELLAAALVPSGTLRERYQREIVVIKRRNEKNVALIAEDELSSLLECVYLLRSPENAKRLFRALEWTQTTIETPQTLAELKEELGMQKRG